MGDYYSFTTEYGAADEFFRAALSLDKKRVEELKAGGVTLTENVKKTLLNGGGSLISNKPESRFWYAYLTDLENVGKEDFVYISRTFFEEAGAPLYYSESMLSAIGKYFYNSAVFVCLIECYDLKKLSKKKTLEELVRKNRVDLLEVCAKCGWLKQAKKRDELIEYANKQNKTECTAWLLDFKNRTADLAAERAKAEKKAERELNAKPDSALELGKLWSRKKGEDGNLIITSYKGKETEVTVPANIGNNIVTAIGDHALSAADSRAKNKTARLMIEKIIVPSGIKTIGEGALGEDLYGSPCRLREVVLPETLDIFNDRQAAENAPCILRYNCRTVAVVPRTENARFYCVKNGIKYRFADEDTYADHIPLDEVIKSDALYSAIIKGDKKKYDELKKSGAVLTDYIKDSLLREHCYQEILNDVYNEFIDLIFMRKNNNADFILSALKAELGEAMYYSRNRYYYSSKLPPEDFDRLLEYFNTKFLDRIGEMRQFILDEKVGHLAVCEKHDWLKNAATRDKMIQYAIDNHKTEATAWLLDFKNRTADLEAERKRAEKRLERQLNAPPPTPEELREKADKLFRRTYNFVEANGEISITGYKGKDVEIEIPREFEGKPITAIGRHAFSPHGKGVPTEHRRRRESITRVVLPDTLRAVGVFAFLGCANLKEVVIPSSVTEIGLRAFLTNPAAASTTLIVERGSFAEEYCGRNNLNFTYTNEE